MDSFALLFQTGLTTSTGSGIDYGQSNQISKCFPFQPVLHLLFIEFYLTSLFHLALSVCYVFMALDVDLVHFKSSEIN
jgi:hypothetical protein